MKKSLLITIALFAVSLTSFSQEITNKTNKEETFNERVIFNSRVF